jgi:hypothetical protein
VTDFSVRRVLERLGALTNPAGGNGGQPAYVAPEHSSERQPGPHADQYALAVLVYESLGGMLPAAEQPLASLPLLCDADPRIPRHVALAVKRALSPTPGARFANVVEFVAALQAPAARQEPLAPHPVSSRAPVLLFPIPEEGVAISKRRWVSLGMLTLAAVGAVIALALPDSGRSTEGTTPEEPAPVPTATSDSAALWPDPAVSARVDTGRMAPGPGLPTVARTDPPPAPAVPSRARSARLFINATPWGRIYVDGVFAGNTPKGAIPVTPGTHRVRVIREGYAPFERTIGAASGQDLRLTDIVLVELNP